MIDKFSLKVLNIFFLVLKGEHSTESLLWVLIFPTLKKVTGLWPPWPPARGGPAYWARYIKYLYIVLPFIKTGAQSSKIGKNYKNCTLLPFFCAWWFHEFFSFRFVVHCDHSPKNLGSLCCLVYVRWTFLLNLILPSKSCLTASHGMMKGIFATENNILASQNFFWLL